MLSSLLSLKTKGCKCKQEEEPAVTEPQVQVKLLLAINNIAKATTCF